VNQLLLANEPDHHFWQKISVLLYKMVVFLPNSSNLSQKCQFFITILVQKCSQNQATRFFLTHYTKMGENIPNCH
jgi:hypothetical protein